MVHTRRTIANFIKSNGCLCKVISIVAILISFSFIITGIVLVAGYPWLFHIGVFLITAGFVLLLHSMAICLSVFQIGVCKRCLRQNESEQQTAEEQVVSQPNLNRSQHVIPPCNTPPPPYPPLAQIPPQASQHLLAASQLSPHVILLPGPPPMLPSYEDIADKSRAPPPYSTVPRETLN